jgi:hypothetical protein
VEVKTSVGCVDNDTDVGHVVVGTALYICSERLPALP